MADLRQRTLVSVRANLDPPGANTKVFARSHRFEIGKPFSFDIAEPSVTGSETLLGLLASDVLGLFASIANTRRLTIDRAEATVRAELAESLRYLGVIGSTGEPAYEHFQVRVYIDSPASSGSLNDAWNEAVARAPLLNTLRRATSVDVTMQLTD